MCMCVYVHICVHLHIYKYIYYVYKYICAKFSDFLWNLVEKMWLFNTEIRYQEGSGSETIYSGSGSFKKFRIRPDPDPQHCRQHTLLDGHFYLNVVTQISRFSNQVTVHNSTFLNQTNTDHHELENTTKKLCLLNNTSISCLGGSNISFKVSIIVP